MATLEDDNEVVLEEEDCSVDDMKTDEETESEERIVDEDSFVTLEVESRLDSSSDMIKCSVPPPIVQDGSNRLRKTI